MGAMGAMGAMVVITLAHLCAHISAGPISLVVVLCILLLILRGAYRFTARSEEG